MQDVRYMVDEYKFDMPSSDRSAIPDESHAKGQWLRFTLIIYPALTV